MKPVWLGILVFGVIVIPILAQGPPAVKPSFEVATVKPSDPGERESYIMNRPGGLLVARGMPIQGMITFAYRVRNFQISGGPSWMTSDHWDIDARAEAGEVPPPSGPPNPNVPDPIGLRLQSLLESRFQLKLHRDTKELPVYELSILKSGSKMKMSDDQSPSRFGVRGRPGMIEATSMDLANLAQTLSNLLGRTVIDKTGLKGLYDMKLLWTPDISPSATLNPAGEQTSAFDPNGPTLFTAIQEQLGLKLGSAKGPVEVLVIDSIQKPNDN